MLAMLHELLYGFIIQTQWYTKLRKSRKLYLKTGIETADSGMVIQSIIYKANQRHRFIKKIIKTGTDEQIYLNSTTCANLRADGHISSVCSVSSAGERNKIDFWVRTTWNKIVIFCYWRDVGTMNNVYSSVNWKPFSVSVLFLFLFFFLRMYECQKTLQFIA